VRGEPWIQPASRGWGFRELFGWTGHSGGGGWTPDRGVGFGYYAEPGARPWPGVPAPGSSGLLARFQGQGGQLPFAAERFGGLLRLRVDRHGPGQGVGLLDQPQCPYRLERAEQARRQRAASRDWVNAS
jgi:hypothetical protein